MITHASSLISWQRFPVKPTADLLAQLKMQRKLLLGNRGPLKDQQFELKMSSEQKSKY